ncbi:hypothetical protein PS664_00298 [Pseudomonas fluorescens]|nr:hypothetical protein PS664_00298 [Pseudomonas fluorescens]
MTNFDFAYSLRVGVLFIILLMPTDGVGTDDNLFLLLPQ